jgi:hypothetical protein
MLLHLPRMEGFESGKGIKNGPALAGHGARAVRSAIASSMKSFPGHLRRSLTWDQGAEMAQHATEDRHRTANLFLRSPEPLATRYKREYEWAATTVLSKRNGPESTHCRRT